MQASEEHKGGALFRFCGVFSEASLSGQRQQLAARLEALQISPQQHAHALAIFVELAQNIIRHGADGSGVNSSGGNSPVTDSGGPRPARLFYASNFPTASGKFSSAEIGHRLAQLLFGVHYKRPHLGNRLADRLAGHH